MSNISVKMDDLIVEVDQQEQYAWFWTKVNTGKWEPETFDMFKRRIDGDTLFIDIGTWIGPTVLYGGALARRTIAVEPDPIAMSALMRNLNLNPHIMEKVTLHNHAIGAEDGALDLYAKKFGDSVTSMLPSRGDRKIVFLSMGIEKFLDLYLGEESKIFIKLDIEGGEYSVVPALCAALKKRNLQADLYVSTHASFMIDKKRPTKEFTANMARNAELLDALANHGVIHIYENGTWSPIASQLGQTQAFQRQFYDTGGLDATLFVEAHRWGV